VFHLWLSVEAEGMWEEEEEEEEGRGAAGGALQDRERVWGHRPVECRRV